MGHFYSDPSTSNSTTAQLTTKTTAKKAPISPATLKAFSSLNGFTVMNIKQSPSDSAGLPNHGPCSDSLLSSC